MGPANPKVGRPRHAIPCQTTPRPAIPRPAGPYLAEPGPTASEEYNTGRGGVNEAGHKGLPNVGKTLLVPSPVLAGKRVNA
jgi:hypothetical protein